MLEYDGTTGAFITTFVTQGSGGLDEPLGLVFGPNGNLFVSSYYTNSVLEYNGTTGAFLETFASGVSGPVGLVFGPNGDLFVSGNGASDNAILEYNGATGAFVKTFASGGGLDGPSFLTFGPPSATPNRRACCWRSSAPSPDWPRPHRGGPPPGSDPPNPEPRVGRWQPAPASYHECPSSDNRKRALEVRRARCDLKPHVARRIEKTTGASRRPVA